MPAHSALCQQIELVPAPAVDVHQRSQRQRRIRGASDQYDVRAGGERVGHGLRAKIRICRHDVPIVERDAFDDLLAANFLLRHRYEEVVTRDGGHFQTSNTELTRQCVYPARRADWIGRTHIGDDANAVPVAIRKDERQISIEERRIALVGILAPQPLRDRQRTLRENLVNQKTLALRLGQRRNDRHGRIEAISGESGAATDMHRRHSPPLPRPIRRLITG